MGGAGIALPEAWRGGHPRRAPGRIGRPSGPARKERARRKEESRQIRRASAWCETSLLFAVGLLRGGDGPLLPATTLGPLRQLAWPRLSRLSGVNRLP